MRPHSIDVSSSSSNGGYRIIVGDGLLAKCGEWARKTLPRDVKRIALVSDEKVFAIYGKEVENRLDRAGFAVSHFLLSRGESRKDLRSVERLLELFNQNGITRTDAVVALGGGVVGDISGFATAIHLRGIPFLNIPTTLLAMVDASVGGKTGVNSAFGKNLIGAFYPPRGVLVDTATLQTLPPREMTAGSCEAIKQGAVGGRKLLNQTSDLLSTSQPRPVLPDLIAAHIAFKAQIVSGDERESTKRSDARSRKILNFGHTLAHALEKVTGYKYLRHGEAVGYGIMFAAELSKSLALCAEKDVKLLNDVVHRAGKLPSLANIDQKEVFEAFKFDKKNFAGSLQMVLLKGIGKPAIVSFSDIPKTTARKVLNDLLKKWA